MLPLARGGDARAAHSLALLLYGGVGGAPLGGGLGGGSEASLRASARWHACAAALGNLDALATLGGIVRSGRGAGTQDKHLGVAIIEACAALEVPTGLNKLGVLLGDGFEEYVCRDVFASAECFEAAAGARASLGYEHGEGQALGRLNLGYALFNGTGTIRDRRAACDQWRMAAAMAPHDGAEDAAYCLYEELLHSDKDEAYAFLELAADLGDQRALNKYE